MSISGKALVRDDVKGLQMMVLKVLLYYGQGLVSIMAQSTIQNGLFYFILPLLQIFNLSIEFGVADSSEDAGYCFLDRMTAEQEIWLNLIIPVLMLSITASMVATKWCGVRWCCVRITFYSAFLRALIISIGSIMAVIFKVLSCRDVAGSGLTVHFYYGDTECYDTPWFVALFALAGLLAIWLVLDVVSWRQSGAVRQDPARNHLFAFVKAFEPRFVCFGAMIYAMMLHHA